MAKYRMIVTSEAEPDRADEYTKWCIDAHYPDMLAVPGVVGARRFKVLGPADQPTRFIALFDVDAEDPRTVAEEVKRRYATKQMRTSDSYTASSVTVQLAEENGEW